MKTEDWVPTTARVGKWEGAGENAGEPYTVYLIITTVGTSIATGRRSEPSPL